MFEGRWVKTIVLSIPHRSATRGAITEEPAWSNPAAKITADISSWLAPNVLLNQNNTLTKIDLTAKTPVEGEQVRVYVPYGTEWYGYLMRRLAERPANLTFFLRALASKS